MWDLIVSVPDHYLSFYFVNLVKKNANISRKCPKQRPQPSFDTKRKKTKTRETTKCEHKRKWLAQQPGPFVPRNGSDQNATQNKENMKNTVTLS